MEIAAIIQLGIGLIGAAVTAFGAYQKFRARKNLQGWKKTGDALAAVVTAIELMPSDDPRVQQRRGPTAASRRGGRSFGVRFLLGGSLAGHGGSLCEAARSDQIGACKPMKSRRGKLAVCDGPHASPANPMHRANCLAPVPAVRAEATWNLPAVDSAASRQPARAGVFRPSRQELGRRWSDCRRSSPRADPRNPGCAACARTVDRSRCSRAGSLAASHVPE